MRPPEVFVRELSPEEGVRLKRISKRAKYQSKRQRAMILLASSTGMPAPQIAAVVRTDESHVRKVIHAFNERGFASLDPAYRGGRPRKTTPAQRDRIVSVARARPDTQGVALTRWSLPKLAVHLASMGIVLSEETLRQPLAILAREEDVIGGPRDQRRLGEPREPRRDSDRRLAIQRGREAPQVVPDPAVGERGLDPLRDEVIDVGVSQSSKPALASEPGAHRLKRGVECRRELRGGDDWLQDRRWEVLEGVAAGQHQRAQPLGRAGGDELGDCATGVVAD